MMHETEIPIFKFMSADGHIWEIFDSGYFTGFPEGTVIMNNLLPYLAKFREQVLTNASISTF